MYSIEQAHEDGRHGVKPHPEDRKFWIAAGCTECARQEERLEMIRRWHEATRRKMAGLR